MFRSMILFFIMFAIFSHPIFAEEMKTKNPAPEFAVNDFYGNKVGIYDLKGRVILLTFWSLDCKGCKKELIDLDSLYKKYAPSGLSIIGLNIDRKLDKKAKNFWREKVSYPLLHGSVLILKAYNVSLLPSTFIIDREGMIRYKKTGYGKNNLKEFEIRIKKLLTEKKRTKIMLLPIKENSVSAKKKNLGEKIYKIIEEKLKKEGNFIFLKPSGDISDEVYHSDGEKVTIGKSLGAAYLLLGSVTKIGSTIGIDLTLFDVERKADVKNVSDSCKKEKLEEKIKEMLNYCMGKQRL